MSGTIPWERVRRAGSKLTTPLLPDDYLTLLNPLWSSRELRGRVEKVVPETEDAATLVIRPGWGWRYDHRPGQYVGIGVQVDGKFQWRSYSVSSAPKRSGRTIAITVRAMPEGLLSSHLVKGLEPGTHRAARAARGRLRAARPAAGQDAVPRRWQRRHAGDGDAAHARPARLDAGRRPALLLADRGADDLPRRDRRTSRRSTTRSRCTGCYTDTDGMLELADLDDLCPDWRERETYACGPSPMLDAITEHFEAADLEDRLHLERFSLELGGEGGEGGTITFRNSGKTVESDGATTVLEAGEEAGIGMPFGCRMGICHTCTLTLVSGKVRDLRNGDEFGEPNEPVQTCVTAAVGDVHVRHLTAPSVQQRRI